MSPNFVVVHHGALVLADCANELLVKAVDADDNAASVTAFIAEDGEEPTLVAPDPLTVECSGARPKGLRTKRFSLLTIRREADIITKTSCQ